MKKYNTPATDDANDNIVTIFSYAYASKTDNTTNTTSNITVYKYSLFSF